MKITNETISHAQEDAPEVKAAKRASSATDQLRERLAAMRQKIDDAEPKVREKALEPIEFVEPEPTHVDPEPVDDVEETPIPVIVDETSDDPINQPLKPLAAEPVEESQPDVDTEPVEEQNTTVEEPVEEPEEKSLDTSVIRSMAEEAKSEAASTTSQATMNTVVAGRYVEFGSDKTDEHEIDPLNDTVTLSSAEYKQLKEAAEKDNKKSIKLKGTKKHKAHKKPLPKWLPIAAAGAIVAVCLGIVAINAATNKPIESHPRTETIVKHSSTKKATPKASKTVQAKLTEAAKATQQPYKIQTTDLGGGYTLGMITYNPDDAQKMYMDYSITAPDKPGQPANDEKAKGIEENLKKTLPVINKTITVKDGSKVSMATFKQSDSTYNTVLMYDKKPFAFVATDKDGQMVNNVTTFYVQQVQKTN